MPPERTLHMKTTNYPCDISVLGGDARQIHLIQFLLKRGFRIAYAGALPLVPDDNLFVTKRLADAVRMSRRVIGPVPLCKNGVVTGCEQLPDGELNGLLNTLTPGQELIAGAIAPAVLDHCAARTIHCVDLMERNEVAIQNAVATAEATVAELIARGAANLHGACVLVLGFGRCAQVLAQKLRGLDTRVTVCARAAGPRAMARALGYDAVSFEELTPYLPRFAYVVNTVPAMVLARTALELLPRDAVVVDIASAPGGIDFEAARSLGLNAALCPGLPGRYAPKASGEILAQAVLDILLERSDKP